MRGDAVGFVDGEVIAWGGAGSALAATIGALSDGAEIVTIVEGQGAPIPIAEVTGFVPDSIEAEAHRGGQPIWWWLLASQ